MLVIVIYYFSLLLITLRNQNPYHPTYIAFWFFPVLLRNPNINCKQAKKPRKARVTCVTAWWTDVDVVEWSGASTVELEACVVDLAVVGPSVP